MSGPATSERDPLIASLQSGLADLTAAISGLQAAQWTWQPAPDAWSIAMCCEHLDSTETSILGQLARAGAEGLEKSAGKDEFVTRAVQSRRRKVPAPENLMPTGTRYAGGPQAFLEAFGATRARAISVAADPALDLRAICARHFALEELDGYQWLLMTAAHLRRHLAQIEEIKTSAGFPA